MRKSNWRDVLRYLIFGKNHKDMATGVQPMAPEEKPMTRRAQTQWIVGAILAGIAVFTYFETRLPASDPRAKCQLLIGMDGHCLTKVTIDRLDSRY